MEACWFFAFYKVAFAAFNEAAAAEIARKSVHFPHSKFKWFLPFKIKDFLEVLKTPILMRHLLVAFLIQGL